MQHQGILLVDKPQGWTSFDVVNYVRKIVAASEGKKPKNTKVGHTGTLDPMATGLLVLLVGKNYTVQATNLSKLDKTYEVSMKLGQTSSTGDAEGELMAVSDLKPSQADVQAAIQKFTGDLMQTPPIYSAIKVDGQRAYKLARQGREVVLEARPVHIYESDFEAYAYPQVRFTSSVSSGTYVRSLVEDLGKELGTGAYMDALRRTTVGKFSLDQAISLENVTIGDIEHSLLTS